MQGSRGFNLPGDSDSKEEASAAKQPGQAEEVFVIHADSNPSSSQANGGEIQ